MYTVKLYDGDKLVREKLYNHPIYMCAYKMQMSCLCEIVYRKILLSGNAILKLYDNNDELVQTIHLHKLAHKCNLIQKKVK